MAGSCPCRGLRDGHAPRAWPPAAERAAPAFCSLSLSFLFFFSLLLFLFFSFLFLFFSFSFLFFSSSLGEHEITAGHGELFGAPLSNHSVSLSNHSLEWLERVLVATCVSDGSRCGNGWTSAATIGSGRADTCLLRMRSMLPPMPTSCASTRRLVPRVQRGLCVQQQPRTIRQKTRPRSPRALLPLQSADGLAQGAASAAMGLQT